MDDGTSMTNMIDWLENLDYEYKNSNGQETKYTTNHGKLIINKIFHKENNIYDYDINIFDGNIQLPCVQIYNKKIGLDYRVNFDIDDIID
ncbi:MAG: hypothetical protein WC284_18355, partial [Candidimonas sp.]